MSAFLQCVQRAKNITNTIAIRSTVIAREFSLMNIIYTDNRGSRVVKNVSDLVTINLIGLPLDLWDATLSVKNGYEKKTIVLMTAE